MSADLNTYIEIEGTQKDVRSMILVIKDYCGNNHDARLEDVRICHNKKFDGKNDVQLDGLNKKEIDEFLAGNKKKIYVEAGGPYGRYGRVDEAGLFEAIAEAAPNAKFKARIKGFTIGQQDNLIGDLKKRKLYVTYSYLPDDCSDNEDGTGSSDDEWITEKSIYDPIKRDYKREYSGEEYISAMMTRLTISQFQSFFGLSKVQISSEKYHDYIRECYLSYQFPRMNYIDFKFVFPDAEIEENEFDQNVMKAIESFDLVSYEEFCQ